MSKQISFLIFGLLLGISNTSLAGLPEAEEPSRRWFNTPWEIRYLLFVNTQKRYAEAERLARQDNLSDGRNGKRNVYLDAKELIKAKLTFVTPKARSIALGLIVFNEHGEVISDDEELHKFTAKLSVLDSLVLVRKNAAEEKPYKLLYWSQGIPGEMSIGPSPCTMLDILRYDDRWKRGGYPGDFGCREWTAQLFNDQRPYIDVTTYTKRGNFIGEFVGWSRFKDAIKPVIGLNGKTWLCLYECPIGEQPGVIGDIKAWTRKHDYPVPTPPPYQPEYPNKNYKNDLEE